MEVGNTQIFNTSINGNLAKNGDSTPIFSKVIGRELSHDSSSDIYLRCRVDLTSNDVGTEAPEFMHLGLPAVNALDELGSSVTLLPESEGRRMDPTGMHRVVFL